jgi:hypothetical protein
LLKLLFFFCVKETDAAEQIALFNLATLDEQKKIPPANIETSYINALSQTPFMHKSTAIKILTVLRTKFQLEKRTEDLISFDRLLKLNSIDLNIDKNTKNTSRIGRIKRVAIALDYSGC